MNQVYCLFIAVLVVSASTIDAMALANIHCKLATCREFHHGLKTYPRYQKYVETCYETVQSLQNIPRQHGKCLDETTAKINPACIRALAKTIKNCMSELDDLSQSDARFYCGYTLMKNCAVNVGLERFQMHHQSRLSN